MSISWGKKQRYKFNSGVPLTSWSPPALSAVYALTYKQDPATKPKSHTVLYFGHAEDLSQQASGFHKHVLDAWVENGGEVTKIGAAVDACVIFDARSAYRRDGILPVIGHGVVSSFHIERATNGPGVFRRQAGTVDMCQNSRTGRRWPQITAR